MEKIAQSTTDYALPTATNIQSLQRLACCGKYYTAAVTTYGPRGSRPNVYVPTISFEGTKTRLLCQKSMPSLRCPPRPLRRHYIEKSTACSVFLLSAYLMLLIIAFAMEVQCLSCISSVCPMQACSSGVVSRQDSVSCVGSRPLDHRAY
jgi:hypothetical protein